MTVVIPLQAAVFHRTRGFLTDIPDSQPLRDSLFERMEGLGIDHRNSMGTWIDDSVGAVLQRLDQLGLCDNTVVRDMLTKHQYRQPS